MKQTLLAQTDLVELEFSFAVRRQVVLPLLPPDIPADLHLAHYASQYLL